MSNDYKRLFAHYENCYLNSGDNHKGVDWPNYEDTLIRHRVMSEVVDLDKELTLLDVGCGLGHFYEYILHSGLNRNVKYTGLDISETFIEKCRQKFSDVPFVSLDLLVDELKLGQFDYAVFNGVFTIKRDLTEEEMWDFFTKMLLKVFSIVNEGIAFNVMSKNVDWERNDLFHVSLDKLTHFICKNLSKNFVVRNDYGLYEYTVYIYKTKRINHG